MVRRGHAVGLAVVLIVATGRASAHQLGGSRFDAALPEAGLLTGAGLTVALTVAWIGLSGRLSRADGRDGGGAARRSGGVETGTDSGAGEAADPDAAAITPREATLLRRGARWVFFAVFLGTLAHGLAGPRLAAENLATVFVWALLLKGVALASILAGSPWRVLSPWEALYDLAAAVEGEDVALVDYPAWLGSWPAVVGFVAVVGVLANLTVAPRSPPTTVALVTGYATAMVVGGVAFGRVWFRRGDAFAVFFALLGRVAPLPVRRTTEGGYAVAPRRPWRGCLDDVLDGSTVVAVLVVTYTLWFEGLTGTELFRTVRFGARDLLPVGVAGIAVYLAGAVLAVGSYALVTGLAARLADDDWTDTARAYAPTVLPVAAAFELGHDSTFVVENLGRFLAVAIDLLQGTAGTTVTLLEWLPLPAFWASQVAVVVGGCLVAVVAAGRVATVRADSPPAARRALASVVVFLVGAALLSLLVFAQPAAG